MLSPHRADWGQHASRWGLAWGAAQCTPSSTWPTRRRSIRLN